MKLMKSKVTKIGAITLALSAITVGAFAADNIKNKQNSIEEYSINSQDVLDSVICEPAKILGEDEQLESLDSISIVTNALKISDLEKDGEATNELIENVEDASIVEN
ncbi:hypothetical protein [Clostridium butyricum]|uniref:Uncharacterized protein n=1 Tax=Clostridium butyricum E4 str. BoNT E BL5262 TaxID=632245 RepID=C4ICZ9_CLOBU|nr:hypothetical protein [Clostridium butyricum]APF22343.1 hypothetical protein NPD4_678 [Clostridium butyricum]EDT75494.1 hypothetical protein CBY_1822 [Clostridium butyricum 5521]EEP55816.1 hypothetical protein CLP_3226 [Clostridium butyricum E4 str. BoNT E BL5262]MCQ2015474.1 hypothetical protein [Clostridium butyricum]MCQ2027723.1 hypothetical protein [Clostridium butyricum]